MISKELLYKQKVNQVQEEIALIRMGIRNTHSGEMKKKLEKMNICGI
jgi:hypothetical protein